MCTGPRCLPESLAWRLYDEHGYRPRELRPCLTVPPRPEPPPRRGLRFRWRRRA